MKNRLYGTKHSSLWYYKILRDPLLSHHKRITKLTVFYSVHLDFQRSTTISSQFFAYCTKIESVTSSNFVCSRRDTRIQIDVKIIRSKSSEYVRENEALPADRGDHEDEINPTRVEKPRCAATDTDDKGYANDWSSFVYALTSEGALRFVGIYGYGWPPPCEWHRDRATPSNIPRRSFADTGTGAWLTLGSIHFSTTLPPLDIPYTAVMSRRCRGMNGGGLKQEAGQRKRHRGDANANGGTETMVSRRIQAEVRSPDDSTMIWGVVVEKVGEGTSDGPAECPFNPVDARRGFDGALGGEKRGFHTGGNGGRNVFTTDNHDVSRVLQSFPSLHCESYSRINHAAGSVWVRTRSSVPIEFTRLLFLKIISRFPRRWYS